MSLRTFEPELKIYTDDSLKELVTDSISPKLITQLVLSELSNLRAGNAHTKTRAEVSGGGKKPWRQKGTGRARHGSTRSPIWVKGGVANGPRSDKNWHKKINKTARMAGLRFLTSDRYKNDNIFVYNNLEINSKTKEANKYFQEINSKLNSKNSEFLIIYTNNDKKSTLSFSNLGVNFLSSKNLKLYKLAQAKYYVFTPDALKEITDKLKSKYV